MKKFFLAILSVIYLGVSSGVAYNVHYCMGKISSIDLMHKNDKCGKCGMKSNADGCCKDEFKIIKLNDSHKLIANDINIVTPVAIIENLKRDFDPKLFSSQITSSLNNHSPPESPGIALNILHCVFRI
jgi:hypothetical protein